MAGVECLLLRTPAGGIISVAREWTDKADPSPCGGDPGNAPILDAQRLLSLAELLHQLSLDKAGGVDK
jgi:hypothetical protein